MPFGMLIFAHVDVEELVYIFSLLIHELLYWGDIQGRYNGWAKITNRSIYVCRA